MNTVNKNLFKNINIVNNTEVDRLFDRVNIFTFDFKNLNDAKRYKAIGYRLNPATRNSGLKTNFISHICEQPYSPDFLNQTNSVSITEITSNILGHETVSTTNVKSIMHEDPILKIIDQMVVKERPATNKSTLSEISISEYGLSLEYTLIYE